jgi:hypothetical protein
METADSVASSVPPELIHFGYLKGDCIVVSGLKRHESGEILETMIPGPDLLSAPNEACLPVYQDEEIRPHPTYPALYKST